MKRTAVQDALWPVRASKKRLVIAHDEHSMFAPWGIPPELWILIFSFAALSWSRSTYHAWSMGLVNRFFSRFWTRLMIGYTNQNRRFKRHATWLDLWRMERASMVELGHCPAYTPKDLTVWPSMTMLEIYPNESLHGQLLLAKMPNLTALRCGSVRELWSLWPDQKGGIGYLATILPKLKRLELRLCPALLGILRGIKECTALETLQITFVAQCHHGKLEKAMRAKKRTDIVAFTTDMDPMINIAHDVKERSDRIHLFDVFIRAEITHEMPLHMVRMFYTFEGLYADRLTLKALEIANDDKKDRAWDVHY